MREASLRLTLKSGQLFNCLKKKLYGVEGLFKDLDYDSNDTSVVLPN